MFSTHHYSTLIRQKALLHFASEFQISLEFVLQHDVFMKLSVIDGDRRLSGDTYQNLKVLLSKALPLIDRIDLKRPDDLFLTINQRGTDH